MLVTDHVSATKTASLTAVCHELPVEHEPAAALCQCAAPAVHGAAAAAVTAAVSDQPCRSAETPCHLQMLRSQKPAHMQLRLILIDTGHSVHAPVRPELAAKK